MAVENKQQLDILIKEEEALKEQLRLNKERQSEIHEKLLLIDLKVNIGDTIEYSYFGRDFRNGVVLGIGSYISFLKVRRLKKDESESNIIDNINKRYTIKVIKPCNTK